MQKQDLMGCGHPAACVSSSDEGTNWCAWCASEAQLEARIRNMREENEWMLLQVLKLEKTLAACPGVVDDLLLENERLLRKIVKWERLLVEMRS